MSTQEIITQELEVKQVEAPVTTLAPAKQEGGIVQLAADPEKIKQQVLLFDKLKSTLLNDRDYQEISGKRYIKKSGWRMFALAFNISDEITKEERKEYESKEGKYFVWEVTARATAPNGRYSEATASCASNEKRFSHVEHDVRATAHTRAKNRAISDLIGGGEVSAEEMNGTEDYAPSINNHAYRGSTPDQPSTKAQANYINTLLADLRKAGIEDGDRLYKEYAPDGSLTKKSASELIEKLKAI